MADSILISGRSDVGVRRRDNEDRALVVEGTTGQALDPHHSGGMVGPTRVRTEGTVLLVADGLGGRAGGATASGLTVESIRRRFAREGSVDSIERFVGGLVQALVDANRQVRSEAEATSTLRGMGTTATLAGIAGDHVYVAQVGDSRAYLLRRGSLVRLTRDQSLVQDLIDSGILDESDADSVADNVLLQAVGTQSGLRPATTYHPLREGDRLILCSDGLSQMVPDGELETLASEEPDGSALTSRLVRLANERGGPDNTTVLVGDLVDSGLPTADDGDVLSPKPWR